MGDKQLDEEEKLSSLELEAAAPPPARHRTVLDYDSTPTLHTALNEANANPTPYQLTSCDDGVCFDWQTPHLDARTSDPESLDREVERLMVLKEYLILDSDREEKFERITALAGRIFDMPICLVCLVDIGRQWFMSAT